jgi:hypothetical protein
LVTRARDLKLDYIILGYERALAGNNVQAWDAFHTALELEPECVERLKTDAELASVVLPLMSSVIDIDAERGAITGTYSSDWQLRQWMRKRRDNFKCRRCPNDDPSRLVVHHVRYISKGGSNQLHNLVTLCTDCHLGEHPYLRW